MAIARVVSRQWQSPFTTVTIRIEGCDIVELLTQTLRTVAPWGLNPGTEVTWPPAVHLPLPVSAIRRGLNQSTLFYQLSPPISGYHNHKFTNPLMAEGEA